MKALIDKLANGNIEYIHPQGEVSEKKIELSVAEGEKVISEFYIKSTNDRDIKGIVYSNDVRVELLNNQFFGKHNTIKFYVSAKYLKAGTEIESNIVVVSNSGELEIPVSIRITPPDLKSSIGIIVDINDFINLVSYDYEEALKFFLSKNFKKYILKDDVNKCTLYERLMKNANREIAMEEFMVAMGLKNQVTLSLVDAKKEYRDIKEAYGDVLQINRSCSGYVDIDVEIEGDFLAHAKTKITNDDFAGNTYEYPYLINSVKLHQGENHAKIIFKTSTQKLVYEIVVWNRPNDVSEHVAHRNNIIKIMRSYLEFRCGKIDGKKWVSDMEVLSLKMMKKNEKDMIAVLLSTQVSILSGNEDKSSYMLARLSHLANDPEKVEYYCYYLYLKTLMKKNSAYTEDVKKEIKSYFENGYDKWGLLWIILYLDDRYTQNPSLKYTLIKDQYNKGCTSPVMYYEAISVLNDQPALLRLINPFELQVLNFGAKMGIVNDKLARQLMIVLEREKNTSNVMLRLLMRIYKVQKNVEVLEGICRLLINSSRYGKEYYEWFDKGVKADLKIAELMEYYIYSVANQGYINLRPSVYMYFGFNAQGLGEYQAYLFANIIANRDSMPNVYEQYKDVIKKYAVMQIVEGNINEDLKVVYKNVVSGEFEIDEEMKKQIPAIVNSYELTVKNTSIKEAIICHKEIEKVEQVVLLNGKAIVEVYTDSPIILFVDDKGRRLANIEYKLKKIIDIRKFKVVCEQIENSYTNICRVNECMKAPEKNKCKDSLLIKVWNDKMITKHYKNSISNFVIDYCNSEYDAGELNEFLLEIDPEILSFEKRNRLVELLIKRNKLSKASSYIVKYGITGIDYNLLLQYAGQIISNSGCEEDDKVTNICRYLFINKKYDALSLEYLQKYYSGPTDEMYDMWKACNVLGIDNYVLTEKLIVQMIFERRNENRMLELFVRFHESERGRNIKKAFFTYFSYIYFNSDKKEDVEFFKLMEEDMIAGMRMSEICKMSYLWYIVKLENISKEQINLCKELIYELTEISIVFEFYKKFSKWFKMPYSILDKTIIDYRTNPKSKVFIMYKIYDEDGVPGDSITEEMSSVYPGIFVKKLTMFYGEKVVYTIIDKDNEGQEKSKEQTIHLTNKESFNEENKFGQINGMLISQDLGRTDALDELMKNYEFNRQVSEELFKLL